MLGWLRNLFSTPRDRAINRLRAELFEANQKVVAIKARYESAVNNDETLGLWSKADNLSSKSANSLPIRKDLRIRSRHEAGNSAHMKGIAKTLANDFIGTGPSLQCLMADEDACDKVETAWDAWSEEICLAQKLHTFIHAEVVDGEGVAKLINNDALMSSVRLDVQVIECDLLSTPYARWKRGDIPVDGIEFDRYGNVSKYHILNEHPGDLGYMAEEGFKTERASNILHYFQIDRPQQARGIPRMTPSLLVFGHLRQYAAAVLAACQVAACLSAIVHTKAAPDTGFVSAEFSATDLEPGMMVGAPDGYDVTQMKPEQPGTTYDSYVLRKLAEACHAANIPYSIATGDFSKESYAGGRMGRQVYQSNVSVQRTHFNHAVMNKIFAAWLAEAVKVPGLLPSGMSGLASNIPHAWYYDPWQHIDEVKAATAITENLNNFTTTLAIECAKLKLNYRKIIKQRIREMDLLKAGNALILPPGTPPLNGQDATAPTGVAA